MKAPNCRLCGHEHWGNAHMFAEAPSTSEANANKPSLAKPAQPSSAPVDRKAEVARLQEQIDKLATGTNGPSPNRASPNSSLEASPNMHSAPNARWRDKHRDQYNAGPRELMHRKRSAARAAATA
jgi:hypothetical protein